MKKYMPAEDVWKIIEMDEDCKLYQEFPYKYGFRKIFVWDDGNTFWMFDIYGSYDNGLRIDHDVEFEEVEQYTETVKRYRRKS